MDKFERLEGFCRTRELAVKNESFEDTCKDIAIYSTLAMILYRKGQDDDEYSRKILSENGLKSGSFFTPVDEKLQSDMDYDHPIMVNARAAEKGKEPIWTSREDYIPDSSAVNKRQAGEITSLFDK